MQAAFKEAFAMYAELAASNPQFETFYDPFLPYWKKEQLLVPHRGAARSTPSTRRCIRR